MRNNHKKRAITKTNETKRKEIVMFNLERREEIIKYLEVHTSASVSELSSLLFVSPPTLRRDLDGLEKEGKVIRTHGGVVLRKTSESEIPLILRQEQNSVNKKIIARKASELIHSGDVIFLDASSTASYLIPYFKKFNDILVVTNSPKSSLALGRENIKNYCTGGLLLAQSIAYVGSEATEFLSRVNADLFFFSSRGYMPGGNVTDSSVEESEVKRAMMKNAEKSVYLCDSSKKGQKYMYNICRTDDLFAIIDEE